MKKRRKQMLIVILLFSLAFSNLSNETFSSAATKKYAKSLKVSRKQIYLKVGQKKKITYKVKAKKSASKKIDVRTKNTKIANATVKKHRIVLTGKKKGQTKIIVSTKAKNRKGKKIKVVINKVVRQEKNTSIQNPKYSHEPTISTLNPTAPSKCPTANPQKTDMPSVLPTETPLDNTTNTNSTSMPSSPMDKTIETTTFEDFSKAAANLVKENKSTNGSSIAANDEFYTKRLIVKGNDSNIDFESYNAIKVIKSNDNIYLVQFATSSDAKTAMSKICNLSNVEYVEADSYSGVLLNKENVGIDSKSWGVSKIGADHYANTIASNQTSEIKVAVVDSGVSDHTFLAGRISNEGYDFVDNDALPNDLNSHGTHVSGTIVDCTPNLKVNILPVRVLDEDGNGYDSIVGVGIRYAVDHGAKVINLSLGGGHSQFLDDSILYALGKGVVVVVAAGNDYGNTSNHCPAHMTDVIVVGAVDENDNRASFSNVGSSLDVVAPGVGIVSCVPGGGYKSYQGTSMATPHVSAIAAMFVLSFPDKSPTEIENMIKSNTRDLGEIGRDNYYGHGIPDLSKCAVVTPSSISLNRTSATIETGKTVSLTATITPSNATDKTVTWSSSNTSVATVSGGIVTGKSVGNATITAKTNNGKTATCIVTVKNSIVEVTGITLNSTSISLEAGKTTTLITSITPSNATDKTITWSSSNTSVATVSNGTVAGKSAGTATIMATTSNGKTAICNVQVTSADIKVPTNIYIVPKNVSVELGKSITLDATIQPNDASDKTVTWYSSNTSIATVNNGIVSGKAIGKVTITAKTVNGYTATSTVEVGRSKQTKYTPVLVYKDNTGYHEIDSGYGSSYTRVNKASDLYIRYYIDTELSVDAKVKIYATDKNANSGTYASSTYGRSSQQGIYAYYRIGVNKLDYYLGKERVYVELQLANGTVPDGYKMERGDSYAFYLDFY